METFFTKDKNFYKVFFRLMLVVALQNLVAYSVNMLDNMMLGSYDQNALSGAATVNQIFFVVNQLAIAIGNALIVMSSQYWGKKDTYAIRKLTGIVLIFSLLAAMIILAICSAFPEQLLGLFTTSPDIIMEGQTYLKILKWTFVLFLISNLLISMLRSVETVQISFVVSVISLIVNGGINYTLIFGHFGFPEMGIKGAAIGTLTARSLEFLIVLFYVAKIDKKVRVFDGGLLRGTFTAENRKLCRDFIKVSTPVILSGLVWAISIPMQTAILGHLSSDAIAANSVATTFFQYLKVIVVAIASASSVVIGKSIGQGDRNEVKAVGRTLSVIDISIGIILAIVLWIFTAVRVFSPGIVRAVSVNSRKDMVSIFCNNVYRDVSSELTAYGVITESYLSDDAKTMLLTDIAEDIGLNAYKIVKHANEEDDSYALIQDSVYGDVDIRILSSQNKYYLAIDI